MIVADSSIWIDFFRGQPSRGALELERLLSEGIASLVVPDLVLFEVLRGFREDRAFHAASRLMESIGVVATGGGPLARAAAEHYRSLQREGITPRSAIDVLLAAFCIEADLLLLHGDRDFTAFEQRRGLRVWHH